MSPRLRFTLFGSLALLLCAACARQTPAPLAVTPTPFTGVPRPVVIDTDMGGDDWMAILYLLQRPEVQVQAITVSGTGLAHCGPGVRNARALAALAGQPEIPVACGRETPLQGNQAFPADWRTDADSLLGLDLPEPAGAPGEQAAPALLAATLQASPSKVLVLATGPLTNLAEALQAEPSLVESIERIYIMGGAIDVPGNADGVAEWNIYVDPEAAQMVFQSGAAVTLVPLDATDHVPVTAEFVARLKARHATPEADFVYRLLTQQMDFVQTGEYYFWDPLSAALLTDESLATLAEMRLEVTSGGRTQASEGGAAVRVAVEADRARFEQVFLDTLNLPDP